MNDTELNRLLKSAEPPERSEEYWQDFPSQVTRQLNRPLPPARPAFRRLPWLAWVGALAAACILVGFLVGQRHERMESAEANSRLLQSEKLIGEAMAMFPRRVRAIVQDEAGLRLVLSEQADVPESTPLWVKICRGSLCATVLTFSGQEVEVAGQKLTVLADGADGVILVGERFAWASDGPKSGVHDLKIQAKAIQLASR